MVSPGKLRALAELRAGESDVVEPSIDRSGAIAYPAVERSLDERDGAPAEFLAEMAERGVLAAVFEAKRYVCPDCAADGMQFTTACPGCESDHAVQDETIVHADCGAGVEPDPDEPGQPGAETDGGSESRWHCPDCDVAVDERSVDRERRYHCRDCGSWFETPVNRLRCRECGVHVPPTDTREAVLYRYPLTEGGATWIAGQLDARESLAETLAGRRYETEVDARVRTPAGDEVPVHLSAEDDLLGERIVADVHETPTAEDVRRLLEAATAVDARPVVLATDGSIDEPVAEVIHEEDVTVLSGVDGHLSREHHVSNPRREDRSILQRIVSVFEPRSPKGRS